MRLIQKVLFALAVAGVAAGAAASPDAPRNGGEYQVLPEAQQTVPGNKVEVTEFFTYSCPHCNAFEPLLAEWVKKNADKIVFKRVHVAFNRSDIPLQRLYNTLEAMGLTEKYHAKAFAAEHVERLHMHTDEAVFDWAEKAGIDRAKFIDTYKSFGMQARVNRSQAMAKAYMINSWPTVAVDGRYITSPYQAGSTSRPALNEVGQQQAALKVMDHLVAKAKAEKK
ncbi:thiol:disulfide interchange protein DsbA/DsbL [Massilia sp. PAMC28688]|uniref:thiol:disulfide interchange protein DsbA/DsbL n=1 Tax=Massilia sp. PAMC28688 TaxID=2861283 RepID=UPI001C632777|nr:thiol:disulfide interchange protein DsbA/DsbL [Massilia sp. PAMC28688]QYF94545.1 thiol:disulfide interchange protein DsbA/DsbL [Massilia sp. PAMC28688]